MIKIKLQYLVLILICALILSLNAKRLWELIDNKQQVSSTELLNSEQLEVNLSGGNVSNAAQFSGFPRQEETSVMDVVPAELAELEQGIPMNAYLGAEIDIPFGDPNNPDDSLSEPLPPSKADIEVVTEELRELERESRESTTYQWWDDELPE